MHKSFVSQYVYFMPLHISSTCAHHQEVKIVLYSSWYHHTYRWLSQTATYRCDDTRGRVKQFWPPDDEHMCSKHVEAWNKLIVKQNFCASSWLITEINILRGTVSKTLKNSICMAKLITAWIRLTVLHIPQLPTYYNIYFKHKAS